MVALEMLKVAVCFAILCFVHYVALKACGDDERVKVFAWIFFACLMFAVFWMYGQRMAWEAREPFLREMQQQIR